MYSVLSESVISDIKLKQSPSDLKLLPSKKVLPHSQNEDSTMRPSFSLFVLIIRPSTS